MPKLGQTFVCLDSLDSYLEMCLSMLPRQGDNPHSKTCPEVALLLQFTSYS